MKVFCLGGAGKICSEAVRDLVQFSDAEQITIGDPNADAARSLIEELNDNRLYQAYYAAWDSRNTDNSVKKCWDRRVSHYNALQNLMGMNRELAQIILINMPDEDPGDMISIYREQYDRVMNPLTD